MVIDRLFDTLDSRMKRWRNTPKHRRISSLKRSFGAPFNKGEVKEEEMMDKDEIMDTKLHTAFQISAAISYLHSHNIIFRDLKPSNVVFDVRGDVRIFDFGLARIMPANGDPYTDTFDMSGAGSPRYMAPECLVGQPYNLKVDIYSFSIILWEILSNQTAYSHIRRRRQLITEVVDEHVRPIIDEKWPERIVGMLESSFDRCITTRPRMKLWYKIIREELVDLRGGDQSDLSDSYVRRRRTFESMRNIYLEESLVTK